MSGASVAAERAAAPLVGAALPDAVRMPLAPPPQGVQSFEIPAALLQTGLDALRTGYGVLQPELLVAQIAVAVADELRRAGELRYVPMPPERTALPRPQDAAPVVMLEYSAAPVPRMVRIGATPLEVWGRGPGYARPSAAEQCVTPKGPDVLPPLNLPYGAALAPLRAQQRCIDDMVAGRGRLR